VHFPFQLILLSPQTVIRTDHISINPFLPLINSLKFSIGAIDPTLSLLSSERKVGGDV
jgi:hypothetical protein